MTSAANITEQSLPAFPYTVLTHNGVAYHAPDEPGYRIRGKEHEAHMASDLQQSLGPLCFAMVRDIHALRGRAL